MQNTPFLLIILDGWGAAPPSRSNAITEANTPAFDHLIKNYWIELLQASGESVGLPWGEMGNSEVGHLSIGSGKIIYQDLPRITGAIADGSFFVNQTFIKAVNQVKKIGGKLHIAGLLSDGGVHSHIEHLYALLEFAVKNDVDSVVLHCFLDGRDTGYNTALGFIEDLENRINKYKNVKIATIAGRFFAMDRDNRWERISSVYDAVVYGRAEKVFGSPRQALEFYYQQGIFDEQIPPTIVSIKSETVANSDAIIFFNFRADRMRQIALAFSLPDFNKFDRQEYLKDLLVVTMTEYDKDMPVDVAFPVEIITNPLAKVLSDLGSRQLHIAETEKYAHITFFFNGGREEPFPGEDRILIPSPQHVATYDEAPEMSAPEITDTLIREINTGKYEFFVVNFANVDMVAHTGNLSAAIIAIETIDKSLKQLTETIMSLNGVVLITSDHGNAEVMFDSQTGEINKEHSVNPVPCIIIGRKFLREKKLLPDLGSYTPSGVLSDIAPTILKIMNVEIPKEMTGRSLV